MSYEPVRDQLHQLKPEAALNSFDPVLERAQKAEKLSVEVMDELLLTSNKSFGLWDEIFPVGIALRARLLHHAPTAAKGRLALCTRL